MHALHIVIRFSPPLLYCISDMAYVYYLLTLPRTINCVTLDISFYCINIFLMCNVISPTLKVTLSVRHKVLQQPIFTVQFSGFGALSKR
jgi:hypothetical protein